MIKFKFLPHTADIKFQANGKTKDALFENCALAVSSAYARGQKIKDKLKKTIQVSGKDNESLLYNFLEELIFQVDANYFITLKAKVKIEQNQLKATLFGDKTQNYGLDSIKAVTYHQIYVKKPAWAGKPKLFWTSNKYILLT